MDLEYENAKQKLLTFMDDECQRFFVTKGHAIEYGYTKLLQEKLSEAENIFANNKEYDIRAKWALFMISLIKGQIREYATYLELRDFLEIDLNILIHYGKGDYVEKIIRYSDFMYTINPEVYKFIGRVFYNNDLKEQAMFFLKQAKNYFYNDPELHYLLSYIYYSSKDFVKAEQAAKDCLYILPKYFPALNMLKTLQNI